MIVKVKAGDKAWQTRYVEVPDGPHAVNWAFRFVMGRREKDYQELVETTHEIEVTKVSKDTIDLLQRLPG